MTKRDEKKLLHRAIDGEASQAETTRLRRRLETDGKVRAEFEQLKKVVKDTEKIRIDVPPDFTQKVMSETRKLRRPGLPPPRA
jgi:anti-sigma factor RsiW